MDVIFAEEIQAGLISNVVIVFRTALSHGAGNVEFCRGVLALAEAQAELYRLEWPTLVSGLQRKLRGRDELLELVTRALPE